MKFRPLYLFVLLIFVVFLFWIISFLKTNNLILQLREKDILSRATVIDESGYIEKCWRKKIVNCLPTNIYQNVPSSFIDPYYEYGEKQVANKFSSKDSVDLSFEGAATLVSNTYSSKRIKIIDVIRSIENELYGHVDDDKFISDKRNKLLYTTDLLSNSLNKVLTNTTIYSKIEVYEIGNNFDLLSSIVKSGIPAIVSLENRYVVVNEIEGDRVKYIDTSRALGSYMSQTDFVKLFKSATVIQLTDKGSFVNKIFSSSGIVNVILANCIIYNESKFDPDAQSSPNTDGTQDFGLMQINSQYWPGYTFRDGFYVNWDQIFNPEYNIDIGYHIFHFNRANTFNAWSTKIYCSPN